MIRAIVFGILGMLAGCTPIPTSAGHPPPWTNRQLEGIYLECCDAFQSSVHSIILRYYYYAYFIWGAGSGGVSSGQIGFELAGEDIRRTDSDSMAGGGGLSSPKGGQIWIAARHAPKKLVHFDLDSRTVREAVAYPGDSLFAREVQEDSEGRIWAVFDTKPLGGGFSLTREELSAGAGSYVWDGRGWARFLEAAIMGPFRYRAGKIWAEGNFDPKWDVPVLAEIDVSGNTRLLPFPRWVIKFKSTTTPSHGILTGTTDWVWRYDEPADTFTQLNPPAIENRWINAVLESSASRLWLAGNDGIFFSDDEKNWNQILWTESQGERYKISASAKDTKLFPDRLYYDSVAEDAKGGIWFFSGPVIVRVNPQTMEALEFRSTYPLKFLAGNLGIGFDQAAEDPLGGVKPLGPFPARSVPLPQSVPLGQ